MVLWKTLRSVLLWSEAEDRWRPELFDDQATDRRQLEILASVPDDEPELLDALENLLAVLDRPDRTDREFVAVSCTRIATWAEGRQHRHTAFEYRQAAALSSPVDPAPALSAGRAARDLAKHGHAEAWIHRAIGLARQAKDWGVYVDAHRAHGKMMRQRGNLPAARRSYLRALRRARRERLREREAIALHHLFVLESRAGNSEDAIAYAREAVTAHRPGHRELPHLAHDIAYHWLQRGEALRALPVFIETLRRSDPDVRHTVLGSIGWAAGKANDRGAFEWSWRELETFQSRPGLAEAWVDMARGALELECSESAEQAARIAESVAKERGEGQMRFLADAVLDELRTDPEVPALPTDPASDETTSTLARDLIRVLQAAPEHDAPVGVGS